MLQKIQKDRYIGEGFVILVNKFRLFCQLISLQSEFFLGNLNGNLKIYVSKTQATTEKIFMGVVMVLEHYGFFIIFQTRIYIWIHVH